MTHIFKAAAEKRATQEAQKSLRKQSRKNPHRRGGPDRPSRPHRAGVRTGFFCGRRNKRLALDSGRAVCRGVLGRRVVSATRSAMSSHQGTIAPRQGEEPQEKKGSSGTTSLAVEEESRRRSTPTRAIQARTGKTAGRGRVHDGRGTTPLSANAFNTTTYWSQYVTIHPILMRRMAGRGTRAVPLHLVQKVVA